MPVHRRTRITFDQKETKSSLTRNVAYDEAFLDGMREHLATFGAYPPKQVMSLHTRPPG